MFNEIKNKCQHKWKREGEFVANITHEYPAENYQRASKSYQSGPTSLVDQCTECLEYRTYEVKGIRTKGN